jgi:hypothetical protein
MKKILIGLISVISIFGLISCESNNLNPMGGDPGDNSLARHHGGRSNPPCPAVGEFAGVNSLSSAYGVYDYTLWANKNLDVGTVSITNDDENIYVTYTTDETVELEKIRVFVWTDLEDISNKRPSPGHADYSANHIDAFTYTAVIPTEVFSGDNYYITANAKVKYIEDEEEEEDDDEDEDDEDDEEDDDEEDDDHGHHGHGHHQVMRAYAGDTASPACFEEAGRKWWSYVGYTVESYSLSLSDCDTSETLYAVGGLEAGTVSIANDEDNLYITIASNELCDLDEVYLDINPSLRNVGDPATYNANIYITATDLPADSYTITVPFADTGLDCNDQFIVKARAVLTVDTATGSSTLDGVPAFGGNNYERKRSGEYYGDITYDSCCPGATPQ